MRSAAFGDLVARRCCRGSGQRDERAHLRRDGERRLRCQSRRPRLRRFGRFAERRPFGVIRQLHTDENYFELQHTDADPREHFAGDASRTRVQPDAVDARARWKRPGFESGEPRRVTRRRERAATHKPAERTLFHACRLDHQLGPGVDLLGLPQCSAGLPARDHIRPKPARGHLGLEPGQSAKAGSTPVVANGMVFIAYDGAIFALNALNGNVLWNSARHGKTIANVHWSSPIVVNDSINAGFTTNFLANVKTNDALVQVVRLFENESVPHPDGSIDALRDISSFETEFIISDLSIVETRIDRINKQVQKTQDEHLKKELPVSKSAARISRKKSRCAKLTSQKKKPTFSKRTSSFP